MSKAEQIQLEPSWHKALIGEFSKDYMISLKDFLKSEHKKGKVIYPPTSQCFSAFDHTPYDQVKVVVVGQDPYHGPKQAHGLCFSVPPEVTTPPSLKNIFKEMSSDLNIATPTQGTLTGWAKQGVLLLNSTLTVEKGKAGSHQNKGWEEFTDQVLHRLNDQERPLTFLLWGSFAQRKGSFINTKKHLVLKSPHPSPLSAYRGFFGTKPFSKVNAFLKQNKQTPIKWEQTI